MGLPNQNRYRVTEHAAQRYAQRIDYKANTNTKALKGFRKLMNNATILENKSDGTQVWLDEDSAIVFIVDPRKFNIITVYRSYDKYNESDMRNIPTQQQEDSINEVEEEMNSQELNSKTKKVISDIISDNYLRIEKEYYNKAIPIYTEYLDRLTRTAKTTRPDQYESNRSELKRLKDKIDKIEDEASIVTSELKTFIIEDE
jgi:hypothetical protein